MDGVNEKSLRVISIAGGKGGIGKTTISVNLAIAFAKLQQRVLLFDADLGLANVDVLLGIKPKATIQHFLKGECALEDVICTGPYGMSILPATSGMQKMAELSAAEANELIRSFSSLNLKVDTMLIDLASGISSQVMNMTHASQDILIVLCNDPSSLVDSYAVIKILHQQFGRSRFGILVNKVGSVEEGYDVFNHFQLALQKFISVNTQFIGYIPYDDYVAIAARERVAVVDKYPHSKAGIAFSNLSRSIMQWQADIMPKGGIHFFFERLIQNHSALKELSCKA